MLYYRIKAWYLGMSYCKEYVGVNVDWNNGVVTFYDPDNSNKKYKISSNSADCIETESFNDIPPKGFNTTLQV